MQIEPIRIAFVMHVMQVAGAEMLIAEIIRRLGTLISPIVICLDTVGTLGEQLISEGIPVIALGRRPGLDLSVAGRLSRELRSREIELVHAHQYTPFFYSALAKMHGRQHFHLMFTEHGRHYPDVVSMRRRLCNRLFLSHLADEVNSVCEFSARSLARVDGFAANRIEVIKNGIELPTCDSDEARHDIRARLGLRDDRRYVICVARFHPVKDHATLLHAFALVAARHKDVDLLLAGDGPLRSDLERRVQLFGIASRVHFLGVRQDVPELLRAADVFTLTSLSEAASLTVLEAMAARLPVVVTDVGGNPEIVRDGQEGILVSRGDSVGTATAIERLLENERMAETIGRAARRRVEEQYLSMTQLRSIAIATLMRQDVMSHKLTLDHPFRTLSEGLAWRRETWKRHVFLLRSFRNGLSLSDALRKRRACDSAVCWDGVEFAHPVGRRGLPETLLEIWYEQVYTGDFYRPQPGDVIVDAGANVGLFSVWLGRSYPSCRIVAFEPFLENYLLLLRNTEAARVKCLSPVRAALAGRSGFAQMLDGGTRSLDHRLAVSTHRDSPVDDACVRVLTFGEMLQVVEAPCIALLKIDIEGSECEFLSSASENDLHRIARFAIEYHDNIEPGTLDCLIRRLEKTHATVVRPSGNHGHGMLYATLKSLPRSLNEPPSGTQEERQAH